MSEKLSPEEIDELFRQAAANSAETDPSDETNEPTPVFNGQTGTTEENPRPEQNLPTQLELDVLGEVYNISMGAAATAISSLLRMKVDITTPVLELINMEDVVFKALEPATAVEIEYIKGIHGVNTFILSRNDVLKIVDLLLGGTGMVDESAEFNEMHMSAIGEVMNQMMGSSSVALAEFLKTVIDISVPKTYNIENEFKSTEIAASGEKIISARFKFIVGDIINSEMITTCSVEFAREMINMAMREFNLLPPEPEMHETTVIETPPPSQIQEQAKPQAQTPAEQPRPSVQQQPQPAPQQPLPPARQQPAPQVQPQTHQQYQQQPQQEVNIKTANFSSFDLPAEIPAAYESNLELIMDLPIDVSVEIGRTKRTIQDVLELGEGSIVELDKQLADPVDIFVNGNLVAKGIVVVIGESFGVRITEIVSAGEKIKAAKNRS